MSSSQQHPKHRQTTRTSEKVSRLYHDMTDSEPDQHQRNMRFVVGAVIGAILITGILVNADKLNSEVGSLPQPDGGIYLPEIGATE